MRLCLSCYMVSKGGFYCGGCGRTLGIKLCANGHPNAPSQVRFCTTCGSADMMTEPARSITLSWLGPLLAGLVAFVVWRWAFAHLPLLGVLLWCAALAILALLLDTTACGVIHGAEQGVACIFDLWLLGWALTLVPGRGGSPGNGCAPCRRGSSGSPPLPCADC